MNTDFLILTVLVGLGTWLLRFGPILLMRGKIDPDAPLSRFLSAIGPAAITALLVAAVLPLLEPDIAANLPLVAGSATVVGVFLYWRDVSLATVSGAIVYGLVFALV